MTAVYALTHFFVDFCCAWAMFGRFLPHPSGDWYILVYNFCAFALQMPLGLVLDQLSPKFRKAPAGFALCGVMMTMLGCFTHPAILGLGNALFHVGGGVGTIREDNAHAWRGQALGIFVAPGALGLFLGKTYAHAIAPIFLAMALLTIWMLFAKEIKVSTAPAPVSGDSALLPVYCFLVVILRSHVGMAVSFPWNTGAVWPVLCVIAVVMGKAAGGILSARWGIRPSVCVSLALAAVCYAWSDSPAFGVAALFFFNITMPITLYLLVQKWPELPGFSFGLLTFGLFLGFLPTYFGADAGISARMIGAVGSLISLALLAPALRKAAKP